MSLSIHEIDIPFIRLLGVEVLAEAPGRVATRFEIKPEYRNSWGVAHGGALMTLLDFTMGMTVRTHDPTALGGATVEMKVSFFAAGTGVLTCEGRILHATRTLLFAEGEIRDASNAVITKALGTFKLRHAR